MSQLIGHLSLWGDFEIDEISSLLSLQPSQIVCKGDVLDGASAPAIVSTWDLHCPVNCESMQEQLKFILDVLLPKAEIFRTLASKFHADLNLAGSCEESGVLSLDHEVLQQLVQLNLKLNCLYVCDKDSNAD